MKVPEDRVARPTLRCLIEDLGQEVGPPELRATLSSAMREIAADPQFLFPVALAAAEHAVLDKANQIATDPASDRESIVSIRDRSVVKVKTGNRRGALWLDKAGTWWLLAAGRRKDDGSGDFYRSLERFARNSDAIAPTSADFAYLKYEKAYLAELALERDAHASVLHALLRAAADPGTEQRVEVFGANVGVRVDAEPGDEMLIVAFDFTSFEQRDRFPVDVLAFVPGFESLDDWDVQPSMRPGAPETWFTFVPMAWIVYLATSLEVEALLQSFESPSITAVASAPGVVHHAPADWIAVSYVADVEITALCGAAFLAPRSFDGQTVCADCAAALARLRSS